MQTRYFGWKIALALLLCLGELLPASASPWAEVGDNQIRSDIELLQIAGVIRNITIAWPLPWQSILGDLSRANLARQPAPVRAAAYRLLAHARAGTAPGLSSSFYVDATNRPDLVYGFDGMGRGDAQTQVSVAQNGDVFSWRISLGAITNDFGGKPNKLMPDGTYFSLNLGGVRAYAGYLDHWWGPGQITTLQLSNNARPMPQVGFERSSTARSSWPVLRWLGPWQFEFFVAKFDGPQIQSNVYYDAAHLTVNPLPGLELGVAKTEQICGQGHPCVPIRDYFTNLDFSTHPDNVNGEGSLEFKYAHPVFGVPFQIYGQLMNEDYSFFASSGSSHLIGLSAFVPTGVNPVKLTAEFSDTIATKKPFSFGNYIYGYTYTDFQFPDGMHYRGRTLGSSLDTDSTLLSLQASWSDAEDRFYEISLHHADVGNHRSDINVVTQAPVIVNMAEGRISLPWNDWKIDLAGRLQDDQPRPHKGFGAGGEIALRAPL